MYCYNRHTLTQEEHDEISASKLNKLIIKIKKLFSKYKMFLLKHNK